MGPGLWDPWVLSFQTVKPSTYLDVVHIEGLGSQRRVRVRDQEKVLIEYIYLMVRYQIEAYKRAARNDMSAQ